MFTTPQAATLYDSLEVKLNALLAHYKAAAVDGLSIAEIWELVSDAVASATAIVKEAKTEVGTDATAKEVVLHFAEQLYDGVIAPYDIPKIPNFLETRFVDPGLKIVYMHLIEGALNSLFKVAARPLPAPAPTGPSGDVPAAPTLPDGFTPY